MVTTIRDQTSEVTHAVRLLSKSVSEISESMSALSATSIQTEAAVNETSVTVSQIKQTAGLASKTSQEVSNRAKVAAVTAQDGKRATAETIAGMHRVREQMAAVVQRIAELSEQSQSIGDILTTVSDLAEQSNLLAVNAAIEAAKAGEHGYGFTVVSHEIKNLAEQSKEATRQIQSRLRHIYEATEVAVSSAEEGSLAVETGLALAGKAGDAITELEESISQAAAATAQIEVTSCQQSVGMDQVALAMDNIKTGSAQTVASTRTTTEAATQMDQLGQRLRSLVERFKV